MSKSKQRVAILNCGVGSIASIHAALSRLGKDVTVIGKYEPFQPADRFIVPGTGSFKPFVKALREMKAYEELEEAIVGNNLPIMGICVGAQAFLEIGTEDGYSIGLGWVPGTVVELVRTSSEILIPHVGWEETYFTQEMGKDWIDTKHAAYYYTHSYKMVLKNRSSILATCDYGQEITSIYKHKNIVGVQFHPEKSHNAGLALIKWFIESAYEK